MNIKQPFMMAIKSLKSSRMRAFLTMLGIIIGVASVIILVSLISGMSNQISEQFESMGTNLISVNLMGRGNSNRTVSPTELEKLVQDNPEVLSAVSPTVTLGNATIKHETYNVTSSCTGVSETYASIRNYEVERGRFISYLDVVNRQKVCVLGTYQIQELFGSSDPLGQQIKINGEIFTVIGVFPEKQNNQQWGSDDIVIMPYTTAMRLGRNARVTSYAFQATSSEVVAEAKNTIENALYEVYSSSDSYMVMSQAEMLEQMDEIMGTMTLVLVGIAGISLLVGGIGIMNIMLVLVTERIREIGIRKSIGARRRDILGQFLIESATTSALGGIIGIVVGISISYVLGSLIGLSISPSALSIIIAFSVSVFIGIIFGYLPANKAAKLHPIDALRHE